MILLLTTLHKKETAHQIGLDLLKKRLIVCYNLTPIESAYWWKGKIMKESETLMILKTRQENVEKIEKLITKNSGYEVPEVIALKPSQVNSTYLEWVHRETNP
jgi:periplasmic divalent cation tolerance protein